MKNVHIDASFYASTLDTLQMQRFTNSLCYVAKAVVS